VSAPRPATPRALIAGTLLVLAGLGFWVLYVQRSGGAEQHSYDRAGRPPSYVRLLAGQTYSIAIHGGVNREIRLGLDPSALQCSAARPGQTPGALNLTNENKDTKAINQIASFVSGITGAVQVRCAGIGAVYVDDAEDAAYDWSGVWIVLASLALAAGLPLALSGLRGPTPPRALGPDGADVGRVEPDAEQLLGVTPGTVRSPVRGRGVTREP
jgi:hypothetical protein